MFSKAVLHSAVILTYLNSIFNESFYRLSVVLRVILDVHRFTGTPGVVSAYTTVIAGT